MSIFRNIHKIEINALAETHFSSPKSLQELTAALNDVAFKNPSDRWLALKSGRTLIDVAMVKPDSDNDQFRLIQSVTITPFCRAIEEIIVSAITISEVLLDMPVSFDFNGLTLSVRSANNMYGYELRLIKGNEEQFGKIKNNMQEELGCFFPIKRAFFACVDRFDP